MVKKRNRAWEFYNRGGQHNCFQKTNKSERESSKWEKEGTFTNLRCSAVAIPIFCQSINLSFLPFRVSLPSPHFLTFTDSMHLSRSPVPSSSIVHLRHSHICAHAYYFHAQAMPWSVPYSFETVTLYQSTFFFPYIIKLFWTP